MPNGRSLNWENMATGNSAPHRPYNLGRDLSARLLVRTVGSTGGERSSLEMLRVECLLVVHI